MNSKQILITGATGLLGSTICPILESLNFSVVTQSRSGSTDIVGDLADFNFVSKALERIRPDLILNLAGQTNVDLCEQDPIAAFSGNVKPIVNIVDWSRGTSRPPFLVHISTDMVYNSPGPSPEDSAVPINYYSFSKYCGELQAGRMPSTILRTNFFGRSNNPNRKSFSDWLLHRFATGAPLSLFSDVFFSPLSMETLCDYIAAVLDRKICGTFNLGSRDGLTKAEFGLFVARAFGLSSKHTETVSIEKAKLYAKRPTDMRMDVSLFERSFNTRLPTLTDEIKKLRSIYYEYPLTPI